MSTLSGNFVKCAHIRCEEYVQHKSLNETPLCAFHGTYDTINTVTSAEMLESNDTTEKAFYARCENLKKQVLKLTTELNADKMNHGKMIRWNKNFEMCSKRNDVTTCTYFKILNRLLILSIVFCS